MSWNCERNLGFLLKNIRRLLSFVKSNGSPGSCPTKSSTPLQ